MVDSHPKREIALGAVPRYWELELILLPFIKYDFTILRRVIMTLILLKTIHHIHHKNQKLIIDRGLLLFFMQ